MIDLAAEIADCERVGVECALALALNFPRVYDTVPTQKSIIAENPKLVLIKPIGQDKLWVECTIRANLVHLRLEKDGKQLLKRIPLSAVFAFA